MKISNRTKKILVTIGVVLLIVAVVVTVIASSLMTRRSDPSVDINPKVISANYENMEYQDSDGKKLKGWYFPSTSNRTVVFVPGIYENRVNTGYLGPMIAKELIAQGYGVVMYDNQATGESDGDRVTYGPSEGKGILATLKWLNDKGIKNNEIGIISDSMGSAAVLEVISDMKNVGPLILDSSPADMQEAAGNILTTEHPMPKILLPGVFLFSRILYGVDFGAIVPQARIKEAPDRCFLFLHAEKDTSVPLDHSERLLKAANSCSKLVVFPNGRHIETYKSDPDLYNKEVYSFLKTEFDKAAQ